MSTKTQFPQEWLKNVLFHFGQLGFFNHTQGSDDDVRFISDMANNRGLFPEGPLDPEQRSNYFSFLPEQELLRLDKLRVWCKDSEADFVADDYWYVRTLLNWSRISRGCFQPQDLSERWLPPRTPDPAHPGSQEEPIEVSFSLGDKRWTFELLERSGWLDCNLIQRVNQAICHTGHQFASVIPIESDQTVYICCLTTGEIQRLKDERGWKFHDDYFVPTVTTAELSPTTKTL